MLAIAVALVVPARVVIAAGLVYLPFEAWITGFLPGSASSVARYGPEAIGAVLLTSALASQRLEKHRWRGLLVACVVVVVVWALAALHGGVAPSTAIIGYRSELRWVPVAFVVALTADRRSIPGGTDGPWSAPQRSRASSQ